MLFKRRNEDKINVYSSDGDHIIKVTSFTMPERKMNLKQFENYSKNEVEGQVIGSFNVKRILCEPNKRFMPNEFEGFENLRNIIDDNDPMTRKLKEIDVANFYKLKGEIMHLMIDGFDFPDGSHFSNIWYCNMYFHHRVMLVNHIQMFARKPNQFIRNVTDHLTEQ
jgi:hypothetical protein